MSMCQGHPRGIQPHFDKLNFSCPEDYNMSDFVMFLVETAEDEKLKKISQGWAALADLQSSTEVKVGPPIWKNLYLVFCL